jgi:uncharacterized protein YicC (UPF0701 family)
MIENRSLLGTYRHNLDINIQTSSGDKINLSFNNQKSLDMNLSNKDENNELGFSSLQSFSFSYDGDGIDEKDKKEIEAFMKTAQPSIDNFMKELKEEENNLSKPLNQQIKELTNVFEPVLEKEDPNLNTFLKKSIVDEFDKILSTFEKNDKVTNDTKKLLEKLFISMDKFNQEIYG